MARFEPNYDRPCMCCGNTPTVNIVNTNSEGREVVVHRGDMCGPCTFGTADAIDPDEWNEEADSE